MTPANWCRAVSVGSRLRLGSPRFSRQEIPNTPLAAAVSSPRISGLPHGVGSPSVKSKIPTFNPSDRNFNIAPPMPNSASSGCGAMIKISSFIGRIQLKCQGAKRCERHRRTPAPTLQLAWTQPKCFAKVRNVVHLNNPTSQCQVTTSIEFDALALRSHCLRWCLARLVLWVVRGLQSCRR